MHYKICPQCGCDHLKEKVVNRAMYDPATRRTVEQAGQNQEFHCSGCGWTVLVEGELYTPDS